MALVGTGHPDRVSLLQYIVEIDILVVEEGKTRQLSFLWVFYHLQHQKTPVAGLQLHPLGHNFTVQYIPASGHLHKDSVKKITLATPSHYSQLPPRLLHYEISLTCIMSLLWCVILSPLPRQTHLVTQIFLHKSVPPDYLHHFSCSSLKCLQFIRFYFKALVLRNEWSKDQNLMLHLSH